jgi:CheY-like chemotaxis protein
MDPVLVAIGDDELRRTMRLLLTVSGHVALEARSGEDTLTLLKSSAQALMVLLDARLHGSITPEGLLRLSMTDRGIGRHHFTICTAAPPDFLPFALTEQIARAGVPILQMPFDIDTLFGLLEHT